MWRITIIALIALALAVVGLLGVRGSTSRRPPLRFFDDMVDQPRRRPQDASSFFADGRAQRTPPAGTVAWGEGADGPTPSIAVSEASAFARATLPVPVTRGLLDRGRERFDVTCALCHGRAGDGEGLMVRYGLTRPPSYATQRLLDATDGDVYRTITEGKGQMGPYRDRIVPEDRWAIVAWVRVLQEAATGRIEDVPPEQRAELER